jgi:hypothetical protein
MVGDVVEANVCGAAASGLAALLVQTGKYRPGDEGQLPRACAVISGIVALPEQLGRRRHDTMQGGREQHRSRHLRRPAPLAMAVFCPAAAASGEVLAMGDQPLMQMAGEQRDALGPRVMPEKVAGHADLAAAGLHQHLAVEIRPLLDWGFKPGGQGHRPRRGNIHDRLQMRTSVLARIAAVGGRIPRA